MRCAFSIVLAINVFAAVPALAQKRTIQETDLFDFKWIADPQISSGGSRVAFVKVTVNDKKDGYSTSIWTVSPATREMSQLTSGTHDSSPRWSPDGKYLAFVRVQEKDGKPDQPQLFMMSMDGGEAFPLTSLPRGSGSPRWSPDGKMIAFINGSNPEDLAKPKQPEEKRESDVRVISRAVYRSNDAGYLDTKHPGHIWIINAPRTSEDKVTPKQLTSGWHEAVNITWARDSSQIYFTMDERNEAYYELPKTDIYSIPVTGGQAVKLTSFEMDSDGFSVSPNGKQIAFYGVASKPVRSYAEPDLWVMDIARNAQPRNLTAEFDYDVGAQVGGDNGPPRGNSDNPPIWSADGRSIIAVYAKEGKANLGAFDVATGQETDVTSGNQAVIGFRADASKFALLISTPTRIGDLFWLERPGTAPKQLTHINDELFSKLNLTEPEEIWYRSFDGKRIQAWIQKPPDFDANKKYPFILDIHGGPHSAYGYIFDQEFQWMAAKGYVVLYPNPRGSTSYGQEFGNIIQYHYPGDDYKDLMAGVDELIRRGYIDDKRLGVTGGSGGGLLTNWTIGQTTRFAAAVSQRDIASWSDWWYSADFTLFQEHWFKAPPFEDPDDYKARSPITYINNVKTPLMVILGEADYRTPPGAGGEEMFRALKYRKIPTVMVRFPNETHELSRSGQPWHRIERLQHILGWFDHWLMGVPKTEYEVTVQ